MPPKKKLIKSKAKPKKAAPKPKRKAAAPRKATKRAKNGKFLKRPPLKAAKKKRNGEAAEAAELSEQFHGRPVKSVKNYDVQEAYRDNLANLGRLLRLDVLVDERDARRFEFNTNVRVMCSPDGQQLFFIGGKQKLNVDAGGKDLVAIGLVHEIEYHTAKDFHDFEPVDYTHEFGEEGGQLPLLLYDVLNERLLLSGGTYRVERPGIID